MLGDDLAAALPELQAHAESRMASRVDVRRKTGVKTTDSKGYKRDAWDFVLTDAKFRLGGAAKGAAATSTVTIGDVDVEVPVRVGSFTAATSGLHSGDLVEIKSGEHAGLVLQIVEAAGKDQQTALRVLVFGVQRPSEWEV